MHKYFKRQWFTQAIYLHIMLNIFKHYLVENGDPLPTVCLVCENFAPQYMKLLGNLAYSSGLMCRRVVCTIAFRSLFSSNQACDHGELDPLENSVGHALKILGPSLKTLFTTWCPKLVTGLVPISHQRKQNYTEIVLKHVFQITLLHFAEYLYKRSKKLHVKKKKVAIWNSWNLIRTSC